MMCSGTPAVVGVNHVRYNRRATYQLAVGAPDVIAIGALALLLIVPVAAGWYRIARMWSATARWPSPVLARLTLLSWAVVCGMVVGLFVLPLNVALFIAPVAIAIVPITVGAQMTLMDTCGLRRLGFAPPSPMQTKLKVYAIRTIGWVVLLLTVVAATLYLLSR